MSPLTPNNSTIPPASLDVLNGIEKTFTLDDRKLNAIVDQMLHDFSLGLEKYGQSMAMVPTFVSGVPNGQETGKFLALDLGGTNLRVCEVNLEGNHKFTLRQQKYKVSEAIKTGEAVILFDYIADSVDSFLTEIEIDVGDDEAVHLGFTFSFPVEQTALDQGKLLTWTKGFSAKNAVGHDVVKLLQDAFDRKHIHVRCSALVNDTVGTLLSRAYLTGDCILGGIFGTGTNGAYVDDVKTIKKLFSGLDSNPNIKPDDKMVINCEWGGFDNARRVLPVTQFDNKLDRESINPRFQCFEKFVSGMYLGEITRNILLHLIDLSILFDGHSSAQLNTHYGLDSSLMSDIESEGYSLEASPLPDKLDVTRHPKTRQTLTEKLGIRPELITEADCEIVQWACRITSSRAARVSACAIGAVIRQTKHDKRPGPIGVGVDGSMVEFYPRFVDRVRTALIAVVGEEVEKRVVIGMAKDGSGVGAALCALQAKKQGPHA